MDRGIKIFILGIIVSIVIAFSSIVYSGPITGSAITGLGGMCRDSNGVISPCISTDTVTMTNLSTVNHNIRKEMDVFLVAGQSNAQGQGNSAQSPSTITGTVFQYYTGAVYAGDDPVGNADTGSAWPQFGISYNANTGRTIGFVPTAIPGSAQVAAADGGQGHWDTTGALFGTSTSILNAALIAFEADGYNTTLKGILWGQGEQDAKKINDATINATQYETAFNTMIANYRTIYGATLPFYIFRTGQFLTESETGFQSVRDKQEAVADDNVNNYLVFRNAVDYNNRSLLDDNVHYTQAGYNEMGRVGAENIFSSIDHTQWRTQSNNIYANATTVGFGPFENMSAFDERFNVNIKGEISIESGAANHTGFHLGEDRDVGGYLTSLSDSHLSVSGGAENVAGAWIARDTVASHVGIINGEIRFFNNTGLTVGSSYGVTQTGVIDGNGNMGLGTTTPESRLEVPDGYYAQFGNYSAGPPASADCDADNERGRRYIDTLNNRNYICNGAARGWDYTALTD